MSDAPEDKPKTRPRISFLGIDAIARDPANYESRGVAETVTDAKRVDDESFPDGYSYRYGWRIINLVERYEDISHNRIANSGDLNDLLEKHDLYLVSIQFRGEKKTFDYGFFGELYARKRTPSKINVTDIETGEPKR